MDKAKGYTFLKVYDDLFHQHSGTEHKTITVKDLKLVDLTIADNISYEELNSRLEDYGQKQVKKGIKVAKALGFIPNHNINLDEFKNLFTECGVYTHTKLLSEQIFEPLSDIDDKTLMYAPFQAMTQYYISLGYSGIVYGSTV